VGIISNGTLRASFGDARQIRRTAGEEAPVVIIGAGPAGLTAAYELSAHGVRSVILEADRGVGGLSRTAEYKGYLFDIGGHRFFKKVSLV
jgi:protoporphyrinogen oxidase